MAEHPAYPVGLRLTGRRIVVLGGGQVAQRRLPALIKAGADIHLVSPEATPSVEAMADGMAAVYRTLQLPGIAAA